MVKDYINDNVYDFLAEECRQDACLWAQFGKGILSHTANADFWEQLSEQLDCFRICEECEKPMIEGYLVDGCSTYCSDESITVKRSSMRSTMKEMATLIGQLGMRTR